MRRRRLFLFALVLLGVLFLLARALPDWLAGQLARTLSGFFRRPVVVGQVRLHAYPLEVEIKDLRVGGEGPGSTPFLEVPRVLVTPSIAPLRFGRLVLSRLRLEGPRIYVHSFVEGGDNIPKTGDAGDGGGNGVALSIGRIVIQKGELVLEHERVPLDLDLPDFQGRLVARGPRALQGNLSFGPGTLRFGSAPSLPVSADVSLEIEGPVVTAQSGHIRARGTDLNWRGQIRFGGRTLGQFTLDGPVDLDMLEQHVMRSGFGIKGAARWQGTVSVDGSRFRIDGRMEGQDGAFDGNPVDRFRGELAWSSDGVVLRRLELQALGGTGTLDVDVPAGSGRPVRIQGPIKDVDAEALLRAVFHYGPLQLGASATGDLLVEWPKGRVRQVSGAITLDLAERPDGRTPLSGRFEWKADQGIEHVERADLRTASTRVRVAGRVEADDRADLALDADSTDLLTSDDLLLRVRRALGNLEAQPLRFSGAGLFRGRWRGTLGAPVFEGRFSGQEVGYAGVVWGKAEWAGAADARSVRSHSLVLARGGAELWLDGLVETGFFGGEDALDARVRLSGWPAQDVVKAMSWDLDLTGLLTGEATFKGRRSRPEGSAVVAAAKGRYYGLPFESARVTTEWRGGVTAITDGQAELGGGRILFGGSVTDDGVYDGTAEIAGVEAAALLPPVSAALRIGGQLKGRATLVGTMDHPRLRAVLTSDRLFVGDEGLGALDASFTGSGDGRVAVDARCRSARVALALRGSVAATVPYAADLRLESDGTSVDPFLRAVFPSLPTPLGVIVTGQLGLRGPLRAPESLTGEATLSDLSLLFPEYPVKSREPVRLELAQGKLSLRALRLAGEGTDVEIAGEAGVLGSGALAITARGTADLRALAALSRRLRGSGAARLSVNVSGTTSDPRVDGRLTLEGAGLRVRGFPHGLEGTQGTVRFNESALEVEGLTGTLAGGAVELQGRATYAQGKLTSFDLRPVGQGIALRFPEGIRSLLDADLRLFGDEDRQWLTGSIDVKQATYSRRYDVASELLATRSTAEGATSFEEGLRFDLKIRAPGTLRIDNNLANLQARADLTLQGTASEPVVVGRAEVDRGRLYFQGQTYVVRRGVIDFNNPRKIDPLFDIEAETRIRSYRVNLKVNGTLDRVTPTLSSDPPLSSVQILNLLAGADETVVSSLTEAQAGQTQLAATGAATLAAGRLSEQVGLERGVERVFGLNRFSIDPSIVRGGAGTTTSARLTVGKRLTPDLSVIYSQDLRGTEERILSVEYILSDRLSLLLTREQPGGLGFDLRLRRSRP
jgi:translocation and assembly module TamB